MREDNRGDKEGGREGEKVEGLWRGRICLASVKRQKEGRRKEGKEEKEKLMKPIKGRSLQGLPLGSSG